MQNQQKPEFISFPGEELQVHSIFKTIQGEGPFSGTPCVFIRLAGCNLQCPNCDTDYTSTRTDMFVAEICSRVAFEQIRNSNLVVITGGEPFRQNIEELIIQLVAMGFYVQVETNGTIPLPETDWKWNLNTSERDGRYLVCSPKTPKIHPSIQENACALKYVLSTNGMDYYDGLPIIVLELLHNKKVARPDKDLFKGLVYLQPEDSKNEAITAANLLACVDSCLKHGYILNLQIHKIIGVA